LKKIRVFALIAALFMMLSLCACGDNAAVSGQPVSGGDLSGSDASVQEVSASDANWYAEMTDEQRELADVVLSSTDAFNAKDEAGYMATIDPDSEAYGETQEYIRLVFDKYSLTATVEKIEIVEMKLETAVLRVTQTTVRNGEGKAFSDARTVMLHTLVQRNGEWYISSTVVESRTELDTNWDIAAEVLGQ